MSLNPRGSQWGKWDLHIHTPASLVHRYPGSRDNVWNRFISDLEALPEEYQVIGVNDYWFLDGYDRLRSEKKKGRLKNIKLLLPVIELRLNQFGGTESKLSRVNYHVIFSDELSSQVIREQFISTLSSNFILTPNYRGLSKVNWSGVVTHHSLEELGSQILKTVPKEELPHYGSAIEEGFNNLTISLEAVNGALNSTFLQGKYISAVGKTEWADIKWKDGSIADKKHVINGADCVFTAAGSIGSYRKAKVALKDSGVNDRLLDCSDAHHLSEASDKDRIGNNFTWIKADPTFSGLLQAMEEFEQRVFVGDEPDHLQRVREYPSKYIDHIRINKIQGSRLKEHWFSTDLPLNSGLVVIIGNKGSGKSALAEVIGLLGGSSHEDHFSFLHPSKFRNARHQLASNFEGEIIWCKEQPHKTLLSESANTEAASRVQHLPQSYLESLCNSIPVGLKTDFDQELERIIFSHLPSEMHLGMGSLEEVIKIETSAIDTELSDKRNELAHLNQTISKLEEQLEPESIERKKLNYVSIRRDWLNLRKNPPDIVPESDASDPELLKIRQKIHELNRVEWNLTSLLKYNEAKLSDSRRRQADLSSFRAQLEQLHRDHENLHQENTDLIRDLNLSEEISSFTVDVEALDTVQSELFNRVKALSELVNGTFEDDERGLRNAIEAVKEEKLEQRQELSAPEEAREDYLQKVADWEAKVRYLLGQSTTKEPETLFGARNAFFELKIIPEELDRLRLKRRQVAKEIQGLLSEKAEKCAALYEPLQKYMDAEGLPVEYQLEVGTSLIDTEFSDRFLNEMINRQVSGSFSGKAESDRLMGDLLSEVDFNDVESVLEFIEEIDKHLRHKIKDGQTVKVQPSKQTRKGVSVANIYDYLYGQSYLSPRYGLLFGGKPIYQLSPGEKGTLLLIFFLLAEVDSRPLIIDQPEDNLDNNTVYRALVHCFQRAKSRRQVIIVTHNPNLAVVCDADQVIVASMEKGDLNRIKYVPGSVERSETIRSIVDILEGTHPAFLNRSVKYNMHIQY